MKLVNRISAVAILVFCSIGAAGGLILLHGCADLKMLLSPNADTQSGHSLIPLFALGVLIFAALVLVLWISYFIRHVVKTFRQIESFLESILAGDIPPQLSVKGVREEEIISLFSTLNYMRDRQLNLAERLHCRIESEEKLRSEIEYCDDLQLAAFGRLLPEMRRSAGIIKAYSLIELARKRKNGPDSEQSENTILASLKRLSRLSREIDFLSDIAKLERKRWSEPVTETFYTATLVSELTDRCSISLQSRKLSLCCEYNSGLPEYLHGDRELLYQLLHLLIRSVARSLAGESQVTFSIFSNGKNAVFEISDRKQDEHRGFLTDAYRKIFSTDGSPNLSDCALGVIGLEIVRNIAEKTNCLFEVDSDEKRPTVLRLTVPVGRGEQRNEGFTSNFTPNPPRLKNVSGSGSNRELLVLLSDDDKEESAALEELLKYSNIKIVPTSDNASLLSLASGQNKKADGVIISAPFLPEYPARHLISGLRRAVGKSGLPVIVVVSEHSPELANELSAIDGVWLLVQPLNFAQMADILQENSTGEE